MRPRLILPCLWATIAVLSVSPCLAQDQATSAFQNQDATQALIDASHGDSRGLVGRAGGPSQQADDDKTPPGNAKEEPGPQRAGPAGGRPAPATGASADLGAPAASGAPASAAPGAPKSPSTAGGAEARGAAPQARETAAGPGALAAARGAEAQARVAETERLERTQSRIGGAKLDFGVQRAPQEGVGTGAPVAVKGGYLVPGAELRVPAPGILPPTALGLFQTARDKLAAGDDDGALLALHEAVDVDPTRADAWETVSEILNKEGDYTGAIAAADKALAIDPSDARALRAKAYAEFNLGQYQQAFADANRAVALDPGNGLGYLYRAMAEEKLGMKDQAVKDYRLAEKYDPALTPAAEEGLRRLLGGSAPDARSGFPSALVRRVGVVAGSGLLLLIGLLGTASGRRVVEDYTRRLKTVVSPAPERQGPVVVPEAVTVALGAVIGGHYRVVGELGRGGMGAVYKANDEKLQRPVAVKQLLRDARDPETMDRLLKEARLVAKLQHPHIAEIYSVITDRDPMLVFEFIDGESLDKTLRRAVKLPPERARKIVAEVCSALEYAHGCGIIHRDLKPANVMLGPGGAAKVMDFGIAHQSTGGATQTKTSTVAGTPPYMAPEQNFGSVSRASDLYSLAAMAYEVLTGTRPFDGPDYLEPKLRGEFTPATKLNADLPAALDKFFAKGLNPDPTKRFLAARDFSQAFAAALEGVTSPG